MIKKIISILAAFTLLFTLVANTVCGAEYICPLGKIDVQSEKCYILPFKSFDKENNTRLNSNFSVGKDLNMAEEIIDKDCKGWDLNEFVSISKSLVKLALRSKLRSAKRAIIKRVVGEFREFAEEIDII